MHKGAEVVYGQLLRVLRFVLVVLVATAGAYLLFQCTPLGTPGAHADTSYYTTLIIDHASAYPSTLRENDLFIVVRYNVVESLPPNELSRGASGIFIRLDGRTPPPLQFRLHPIPKIGRSLAIAYLPPIAGGWPTNLTAALIVNPTQFIPTPTPHSSAKRNLEYCPTCTGNIIEARDALQIQVIQQLRSLSTAEGLGQDHYIGSTLILTPEGQSVLNAAYGGFQNLLPSVYDVQLVPAFGRDPPETPGPRQEELTQAAESNRFLPEVQRNSLALGIPMLTLSIIMMLIVLVFVLFIAYRMSGSGMPALLWITPTLLLFTILGLIPIAVLGGLLALCLLVFTGLAVKKILPN